ncbi:30S ribosomal protein S15 [Candidatus Pacearchaeota archaeon]|nr:30S ribosomal protein S15 [Candidatus Pacearchaeota archaeon]|tara:strand:- start:4463 stop:4813 length:351 start_codon:yes stop_codon:yes gene_type:complete
MEKLDKPVWVKMKEPELKKLIAELSEKNSPSQIGMILRDQYGIPTTKVFGKKLKAYMEELGIERNEDLENAEQKVEGLKEHMKNNVTDRKAKHKLQRAQSRLNITRKYAERKAKKD